jgi:hypothetical protein
MYKNCYLSTLATFALLFDVVSCGDKAPEKTAELQPLKKYYYPLVELKEGLVYEYLNDSTELIDFFWFFKTVEDEAGNWFLVSTRYNTDFNQDQISRERVYSNGTSAESYRFLQMDSSGQIMMADGRIQEPVMYPFDIPADTNLVYRFKMEFNLPSDPTLTYRFTRDRRFSRLKELPIQGKNTPCAVFENMQHLALGDSVKGGHWQIDSSRTTEIYAQNIGLVKTVIRLSTGATSSHSLKARLTMDEFMQKYQK